MTEIVNYEQLKEWANSILVNRRWKAAQSKFADSKILEKLSKDEDRVIRKAVVENENVTNAILVNMFLKETDYGVVKALIKKMTDRNITKESN